MNKFSQFDKFIFFEVEVSEKINSKNLNKFLDTTFKIHKITKTNQDKVYINFIDELSLYQIYIVKNDFKYFDFQVFELFYKNKNSKGFDLYLCDEFFCLYKDGYFYYYQKFNLEIPLEEFLSFLEKKFKAKIENFNLINNNSFEDLKNKYQKSEILSSFKPLNLNKSYSFYIFCIYLSFLITIFLYLINDKNYENNNVSTNQIDVEQLKIKYKFFSLEEKLNLLFQNIKDNNLDVIFLEFREKSSKLILTSQTKENIYTFLELNKDEIVSSSINFIEDKKLYEAVINVRIFK